ncbi:MAG: hypothetical protein HQL32_17185 [Planctomycetes bacterium]|nr:hypothetical protein [Planctomycetota bacterium]
MSYHKIVGCTALNEKQQSLSLAKGVHLQVCASPEVLISYMDQAGKVDFSSVKFKKLSVEFIKNTIDNGNVVQFDKESYLKFYSLTKDLGLEFPEPDFESSEAIQGYEYMTIQI